MLLPQPKVWFLTFLTTFHIAALKKKKKIHLYFLGNPLRILNKNTSKWTYFPPASKQFVLKGTPRFWVLDLRYSALLGSCRTLVFAGQALRNIAAWHRSPRAPERTQTVQRNLSCSSPGSLQPRSAAPPQKPYGQKPHSAGSIQQIPQWFTGRLFPP